MKFNTDFDYKKRVLKIFERNHFGIHLQFKFHEIEAGRVSGEMPLIEEHLQQDGFAHGGIILAISDLVAGLAAYSITPPPYKVLTAEIKVSYLRPGVGDKLIGYGYVLKKGRKLHFCEAEVFCGTPQKLIAKASTIMAVTKF